ncbi:MAG: SufD family Fe-S cluster assembly protein [Parvularculaceae bacterium]|nr:SufD family Fe-S cluster assembly protein [Parvularculaceae bacterium]
MTARAPSSPLETALAARMRGAPPLRANAFDAFLKRGFPHRRIEGWRWTDFNAALREAPGAPAALHETAPPLAADLAGLKPIEIRIINGRIDIPAAAFPAGVRYGIVDAVGTIPELETNPIAALNVAMTKKAIGIEIAEGVALAPPILIRHIGKGDGFSFAQGLLRLCAGSSATLIETFEGEGAAFHSHLFHLVLKDDARLDRALLCETGERAIIHSIFAPKIEARARFTQASLSFGSRLARHETHAHFVAPGAAVDLSSAALLSDERHSDFTSEIVFLAEGATTRQRHKGVAKDKGRNVFQGKFRVERSAQKTDARMTADALLLSDTAETNAKPELEIYADNVACAHGSTAGALDQNAIFYMRQRGLSDSEARAMLIAAFVDSAFDSIQHPGIAQAFRKRVSKWLEGA